MTIHISAAYLWGVATPFIVLVVLWAVGVVLLAVYDWLANR